MSIRPHSPEQLRILIVDDQRDSVELTSLLLEQLGFECRGAFDGESAVAMAATYQPHVVLLDIELPDTTGYKVAIALRALPNGAHIYIAAVTGWGQESDRRRAFDAGCDRHVVKPAKRDTLLAIVLAGAQRANLHNALPRTPALRSPNSHHARCRRTTIACRNPRALRSRLPRRYACSSS